MVYNLIIWTAYAMALLMIVSLYFSYLKLKIIYSGIEMFVCSMLLISTSLILLWFLSEDSKYYVVPLIALTLLSGHYLFYITVLKFNKVTSRPIDMYILLPIVFLMSAYFIYFNENILMQVVSLYLASIYVCLKSGVTLIRSSTKIKDYNMNTVFLIIIGMCTLYTFRVVNIFATDLNEIVYSNLKDYQIVTVILTYVLQILLLFTISNLIYTHARNEMKKINSGFHLSPLSMIMLNEKREVVDINSRFLQFLGYTKNDLLGKQIFKLKLFKDVAHSPNFHHVMTSNESFHNIEFSVVNAHGFVKQTLISISEINYTDKQNSIITFTDISTIHVHKEKLETYAYYDDLTNLPNRRYLTIYSDAKIIENKRFALMCIDIDNFKQVNDNFGHIVGDEVLVQLSRRLRSAVCEDDFIARYAGDEFIVLFSLEPHQYTLEHRIKLIKEAIQSKIQLENHTFKLNGSMGLSEFPLHGTTLNDLIKQADSKMYEIKRISKSQI